MIRRHRAAALVALPLISVAALSPRGSIAAADPASAATKAQAAFFARDAAALAQLATATAPWAKSANAREQYAHAYVQFRALQLATLQQRAKDSAKAGEACIDSLDAALKREPRSAEALALQSSCYGYLAGLGGMGAIRNGSRSGKSVEAALALEPKNPRVILADGFGIYHRPKFVGGDKARGCAKFREAAAGVRGRWPDRRGWHRLGRPRGALLGRALRSRCRQRGGREARVRACAGAGTGLRRREKGTRALTCVAVREIPGPGLAAPRARMPDIAGNITGERPG